MKEIVLPEIVAIGIYNAQLAVKNREITNNRKTTMFEIELPFEAGGISYINEDSRPVTEDIVICAKPGQIRHTRLPFKCYYIHMIIRDGELFDMLMSIPSYIKIDHPESFREIFTMLCSYYGTHLYHDQVMLQSLILKLIHQLFLCSQSQMYREKTKNSNDEVIKNVIQYIKDNLNSDLSLHTVAGYASFSPIYFHNCFKASTGKTLREYVEEKRIQKAINLLISTDLTLSEIAYECGFSSQSYFSYAFKQRMKVTPREYVKEISKLYEKSYESIPQTPFEKLET